MMINAQGLFWFIAGLITAAAIGFVLVPLLRTTTPTASSLWQRVRMPMFVTTVTAIAALALYLWRGHPQVNSVATAMAAASGQKSAAAPMDVALSQLEQRLGGQGGSDADWELLAQTYDFLGRKEAAEAARMRHQVTPGPRALGVAAGSPPTVGAALIAPAPEKAAAPNPRVQQLMARADSARQQRDYRAAAAAYEQLIAAGGMTADTWADYADVAGSLNGGKLGGRPERYIDAALALQPTHEKALWLEASVQHETKRYAAAVATWQLLLGSVAADSSDAKIFAANLAEDRALAGPEAAAASAVPATARSSVGQVQVSGEIALADTLRGKIPAGLTLFIVAKSIDSPGAPVAVLRTQTGDWPLKFRLDDSLAMLPGRNLSSAGRVTVEARVSRSGTAAAQAGDFQSPITTVEPRDGKTVRLVIDRIVG